MDPTDFLTLLKAAGCPSGLPLREVDAWLSRTLLVSERQARGWRLRGTAPGPALVALHALAAGNPARDKAAS